MSGSNDSYGSVSTVASSVLDTVPTGPVPAPVPVCGSCWPYTGGYLGKSIWLCGCTKRPTFFPFTCFVGPHWYYLLVTYIVIAIPTAIAIGVASLVSPWIVGLGGVLTLCLYTFLSCVGCSNPRIIEKQSLTRAQAKLKANPPGGIPPGLTFCSRGCNVYRELGSAHCNACNVCYVDVDHHCPWTGKCVAKDNIFWFYAFLVAVAVQFVYCVFCVIACVLKFEVPRLFSEPLV